jgi:hypothetical protein
MRQNYDGSYIYNLLGMSDRTKSTTCLAMLCAPFVKGEDKRKHEKSTSFMLESRHHKLF